MQAATAHQLFNTVLRHLNATHSGDFATANIRVAPEVVQVHLFSNAQNGLLLVRVDALIATLLFRFERDQRAWNGEPNDNIVCKRWGHRLQTICPL